MGKKDYESQKDKVKEITERLHQGIKDLFESEKYKTYLKTMSKFTNYSFNNTILIALQRPDATCVAGFRAWEKNFDRHVKKGSKGIQIIEPAPYRKTIQEVVKDEHGNPVLDKSGKEMTRDVEKTMQGFRVGYVFAYEDTEGVPLPEIVTVLDEEVKDYDVMMDVLKKISPVPICFEKIESAANGFYHLETRDIHIDSRLPQLQAVKTTIHEIAHSILHDKIIGEDIEANRFEREVCAESVAYTVSSYLGLDTSDYSFGYIGSWSKGRELKELQQKMELIRKTANTIIADIEKELMSLKMNESESLAFKSGTGYLYVSKDEQQYIYEIYGMDFQTLYKGSLANGSMSMNDAVKEVMKLAGADERAWTSYDVKSLLEKTIEQNETVERTVSVEQTYEKPLRISRR